MPEKYAPRTVAIVALASLVAGFIAVFGGGLVLLRPGSRENSPAEPPPRSAPAPRAPALSNEPAPAAPRTTAEPVATTVAGPAGADPSASVPGTEATPSPPAAEPVSAAGITIGPSSTSRCFNQGAPNPLPGAQCDRLAGLDQHVASKAADIAACARSGAHGRLSLVLDFRFSTSFLRGWGSPTSNVPNAGSVTACVKRVITPVPFATIPHQHDRYLVVVPIDW